MDTLLQDIRHSLRGIRRKPGWALIVIATLAFGIGANTAIYTLINGVLFKPAGVPNPDELVWVNSSHGKRTFGPMSYPDYVQIRERVPSLSGAVAWSGISVALGGRTPQRINTFLVSANYFDLLGVRPAFGRGFVQAEETEIDAHPVVVLGHKLWTRRFAADPQILDSSIVLNGRAFRVIGVAPEGFAGIDLGATPELFVPMGMQGAVIPGSSRLLEMENAGWLNSVGRLAPGASADRANSEAGVVAASLHQDRPADDRYGAQITAKQGGLDPRNRQQTAPILLLLSVVPLLVLAVACANVASLLLAQGLARRREFAMRRALGASRGRLVRQMLTESVLLSSVAGATGIMLASWLLLVISRLGRVPDEVTQAMVPDWRVLAVTAILALITGVLFGLLPALATTRPELTPALKDEGGAVTPGRSRHRLRDSFVIAQVSVSLILLITAGLFLRSLDKALKVDPGFDGLQTAAVMFDLELQGYSPERQRTFRDELAERVRGIPGVQSAAFAAVIPMSGRNYGTGAHREGQSPDESVQTNMTEVTPSYFATMGIQLLRGRDFSEQDRAGAPGVVVVNEALAKALWPGEDAIGKRMVIGGSGEAARVVIAIARDGRYRNLVDEPRPFFFVPLAQRRNLGEMTLVARTTGSPAALLQAAVRILGEMDRTVPVASATTMRELIANGAEMQRAASALLGVFGVLALVMAALGIYGVTAHAVTQRTREIGVRMSLGAQSADVLALFVRGAMRRAIIGVTIGILVSAAVSGVLAGFLFGLKATDGLTFALAAGVLCAVVAIASYVPARRATRVDPMVALRSE